MEFLELKQITEVEDVEGLCSYTPEIADLGLKNFSPRYCQEVRLI